MEYAKKENTPVLVICAKLEAKSPTEQHENMHSYRKWGWRPGLDRLITECYRLWTSCFITLNQKEVSMDHKKRNKAPRRRKIHSDFESGFIRAEVVPYDTLVALGSIMQQEKGWSDLEGRL